LWCQKGEAPLKREAAGRERKLAPSDGWSIGGTSYVGTVGDGGRFQEDAVEDEEDVLEADLSDEEQDGREVGGVGVEGTGKITSRAEREARGPPRSERE
jgi:hypothetical protein